MARAEPGVRARPGLTLMEVNFGRSAPFSLGVEEEFLLLDPACGQPVPASPTVLRLPADRSGLQPELMRFQLETTTAVCGHLSELRTELVKLRRSAAAAAEALGCRLVASGVSPYGIPGLIAVTDAPRYRELARRYPSQTARFGRSTRFQFRR